MDFEITGTLLQAIDPMNVYIDSVTVETYHLISVFNMITLCNYPEAYLTPIIQVNNLKGIRSNVDATEVPPPFFMYGGPGNTTINTLDLRTLFNKADLLTGNGMI